MAAGLSSSTSSPRFVQESSLQLPASCDPPSPSHPSTQKVWVVFGATGQIGRSIVHAARSHNDLVTAVGRTSSDSLEDIEASYKPLNTATALSSRNSTAKNPKLSNGDQASQQQGQTSSPILPLLCDIRVRSSVDAVFEKSLEQWDRYDVVVNCENYGVIGPCEEQDEFQIRDQFETNFWGTLNIIQLSLPYFRTRAESGTGQSQEVEDDEDDGYENANALQQGRYLIFSSTSGALGIPGLGPYCATKHAVEGLIESMLYETNAFDIRATLVEAGPFRDEDDPSRTKRAGERSKSSESSSSSYFSTLPMREGSAYAIATSPAHHPKRVMRWLGDRQPTSATKAAELIWQLGRCRFPPTRLLLGAFAVDSIRERMRGVTEEIEDWRFLSFPVPGHEGDGMVPVSPTKGRRRPNKSDAKENLGEDESEDDADVKMEDDGDD